MTKKTKEAIKATAAIVIVVVLAFGLWIYPLNRAGNMISGPGGQPPDLDLEAYGLAGDTLKVVTEDNLNLWGMVFAPQADTGGPADTVWGTCILVHGLAGGSSSQLDRATALTERGYRVTVYDQRGYGQSDGDFYSGGFFEANDLQSVISRMALEDRVARPLIVWGVEHGATAAIRIWGREDRIDYVVAEDPIVDGRDWQKRVKTVKDMSAPNFMLGIIWWWMKQKSGYEIPIEETDLSDHFGTALVNHPDQLLPIACGEEGAPANPYLEELMSFGTVDWLILSCPVQGTLFEIHGDSILTAIENLVQ